MDEGASEWVIKMAKKKFKIPKGWKKVGELDGKIFFETKRKSRVYKGLADNSIIVARHPLDKTKWTGDYGQAVISMPKFKTKAEALKYAKHYMELMEYPNKNVILRKVV